MTSKPAIRQATLNDLPVVRPLLLKFFAGESADHVIARLPFSLPAMLQDPRSAIFLAVAEGQAVAVATLTTTSPGLEFDRYAELEDLYVLPHARQQGLGSALIDRAKQWCATNGCNVLSVVITTEDENGDLFDYYGKRGFSNSLRSTLFCRIES